MYVLPYKGSLIFFTYQMGLVNCIRVYDEMQIEVHNVQMFLTKNLFVGVSL